MVNKHVNKHRIDYPPFQESQHRCENNAPPTKPDCEMIYTIHGPHFSVVCACDLETCKAPCFFRSHPHSLTLNIPPLAPLFVRSHMYKNREKRFSCELEVAHVRRPQAHLLKGPHHNQVRSGWRVRVCMAKCVIGFSGSTSSCPFLLMHKAILPPPSHQLLGGIMCLLAKTHVCMHFL